MKDNNTEKRVNSNKGKSRIASRIATICIFCAVCMTLLLSFVFGFTYWQNEIADYTKEAYNYVKMVSDHIDGNKVSEYLDTMTPDAYYYEVSDYIHNLQKHSDCAYIYIYQFQDEERLVYIWDTEDNSKLGDIDISSAEYLSSDPESTIRNEKLLVYYYQGQGLLGTAVAAIKDNTGSTTAYVAADILMGDLISNISTVIARIAIACIIVTALGTWVLYKRTTKKISEPILNVSEAAKQMLTHIDSDRAFVIECHTGDEIEDLANSFTTMDAELKQYTKTLAVMSAEKERISTELEIATKLQFSMMPVDFPNTENFEISAYMNPAKEVGGDFYDFFMVDDSHVAIVMSDVSGKGVPAAMFMMNAKTLIKNHTLSIKDDLAKVFERVNNDLCSNNEEGFFVTSFEGILDLKTGELSYVNAGHEPPYVMKKDGSFEAKKLSPCLVLACFEGVKYTTGKIQLEPGDRLFQYTDGATEAKNEKDELFEFSRLGESLNKYKNETPADVIKGVKSDIDAFANGTPQADDLTMLCLDFKAFMTE